MMIIIIIGSPSRNSSLVALHNNECLWKYVAFKCIRAKCLFFLKCIDLNTFVKQQCTVAMLSNLSHPVKI